MKTVVRPRYLLVLAGLLAAFAVVLPALLATRPAVSRSTTVSNERLGMVEVSAPSAEPTAFIVLLSDRQGTTPQLRHLSARLVAEGAAVAAISTPELLAALEARNNTGCHYAMAVFEDLAQAAQRNLGVSTYRRPVIFGVGLGGTLAFLADVQAPANTIAGAVSLGFDASFQPRLPFCGTHPIRVADGATTYTPPHPLPARWIAMPTGIGDEVLAALARGGTASEIKPAGGDGPSRLDAGGEAALEIARLDAGNANEAMPVEEVPASKADTLVVFYSGDGGWRDIDKRIADYLSGNGVSVVGVDSLRYFWRRKSPARIATDLEKLIATYKKRWGVRHVALVGYSMGAGVLPFAWNNLPRDTHGTIKLIAMLSLDPKASFEISASGYLGIDNEADVGIEPAVKTMPLDRVMCFYGAEERDPDQSGCLGPAMAGATLVERPGGHHFDGNYEPIARMILDRLKASPHGL
ncbi:virulence factor family protein [Labrys neptuniae]